MVDVTVLATGLDAVQRLEKKSHSTMHDSAIRKNPSSGSSTSCVITCSSAAPATKFKCKVLEVLHLRDNNVVPSAAFAGSFTHVFFRLLRAYKLEAP